jgi:hypothetical protein
LGSTTAAATIISFENEFHGNTLENSVVKLGSINRRLARDFGQTAALVTVLGACLGACASAPTEPVSERLDPDTATTLIVLNRPVELLADSNRGAAGDPFAYIAPFETNLMGERALFLWVSAPENAGPKLQPQLLCDGQPVGLEPLDGDLAQLKLSRPPYAAPAPWSAEWYFRLPPDGLKCLASAQGIALETSATAGKSERFTAAGKSLASLGAFSRQ